MQKYLQPVRPRREERVRDPLHRRQGVVGRRRGRPLPLHSAFPFDRRSSANVRRQTMPARTQRIAVPLFKLLPGGDRQQPDAAASQTRHARQSHPQPRSALHQTARRMPAVC